MLFFTFHHGWCNNIGGTYLLVNPFFHTQIKHVEINFHFVRDKVSNKQLEVQFIPTKDQLANALTKPLLSTKFQHFCFKLTVRYPTLNLRESVEAKIQSHSNLAIMDNVETKINDKIVVCNAPKN